MSLSTHHLAAKAGGRSSARWLLTVAVILGGLMPVPTLAANTSVVLERSDGRAIVQQEAVSKVMLFSKRVHLLLEIDEGADTLRFHDRCGRSFVRYEGAWRVFDRNGMTEILYELVAHPAFDVPEFVLKRVLKRNSEQMIEQLRREIAARSAR